MCVVEELVHVPVAVVDEFTVVVEELVDSETEDDDESSTRSMLGGLRPRASVSGHNH